MPFGDRMGPRGMGPRTGRGLGYCAGYPEPGYMNPYGGRGYGYGFGGGWGRGRGSGWGRGWGGGWGRGWRHRNWYYATGMPGWGRGYAPAWVEPPRPTVEQEVEFLQEQASWLKEQLGAIEERIADLSSSSEQED